MVHRKKYRRRDSAFREDRRARELDSKEHFRRNATYVYYPGECVKGICGEEAACVPGGNSTHACVCPNDKSEMTKDKLCLTRKTVPLTPSPILHLNVVKTANSTARPPETLLPSRAAEPFDGVIMVMIGLLMICIVLMGGMCWWKRKFLSKCAIKGHHRKHETNPSPLSLSKGLLGSYVPNPQYSAADTMPVPILPRDSLLFVQDVGEGCFGKVFKGELHREDGSVEIVAIKVLKESATKEAEEDFMREVEIMSTFRHSNILSLIGIVLKDTGTRPWMVFEYMPYGDLAEVLRSNSRQLWKPVPGLKPLTKESLLRIALQIAGGMRYLAAQRFVHNDLACRNCLVGSELTVKIADFGMSRDIYTCDYYRIGGSKPVPLRWMSPESVMYRRFTLESDVWSYGVVLWEIYSLGKQPYYGLNNEEVVKLILQGIMLIPPDGCPGFICDLMRACWKSEPKDRIKFPEIYDRLKKAYEDKEFDRPSAALIPPPPPPLPPSPSSFANSNMTLSDASGISLPRPPVFPISHFQSEREELLDSDNYLAPQAAIVNEYLQPLPD